MAVPRRSADLRHCRTQSVLKRRVSHPSHLTGPLIRVEITKIQEHQGEQTDAVRSDTSYFDPACNAFSQHTDGSLQWIPKQIVAIGEDFHSQVGDGKVKTTLYKVR